MKNWGQMRLMRPHFRVVETLKILTLWPELWLPTAFYEKLWTNATHIARLFCFGDHQKTLTFQPILQLLTDFYGNCG